MDSVINISNSRHFCVKVTFCDGNLCIVLEVRPLFLIFIQKSMSLILLSSRKRRRQLLSSKKILKLKCTLFVVLAILSFFVCLCSFERRLWYNLLCGGENVKAASSFYFFSSSQVPRKSSPASSVSLALTTKLGRFSFSTFFAIPV